LREALINIYRKNRAKSRLALIKMIMISMFQNYFKYTRHIMTAVSKKR